MNFGIRKLESRGYRDFTFSHFDTIPECDRHTHTHRQSDRHTTMAYTALSKASRGKKYNFDGPSKSIFIFLQDNVTNNHTVDV